MSETVFEPTDHPHRRYNPLIDQWWTKRGLCKKLKGGDTEIYTLSLHDALPI